MSHEALLESAYAGRPVCVTGGAGFIGSHLSDALVRLGASVRVLDDLSHGRRENLGEAVEFFHESILDAVALRQAVEGVDVVFHQAALGSVPRSVREPELYHRVNTTGTLQVLEAARAAGVGRVVSASSSSVYGDQPELPKVETMRLDPRSPYAATKCAGEHLLRSYACCYGLSGVSLRYFNIFGPRQRSDSAYAAVIPLFAESLRQGTRPLVHGDGEQTRDFTYVDNAVHANLLAGAIPKHLEGQALNIATGHRRDLLDLLRSMAALIGAEPAHETAPARAGDVRHSLAGIDAARELIGYEPVVDFDEGLRRTVDWYGESDEATKRLSD